MHNATDLGAAVVGTGFIGPVHVEALRRLGRPVVGILGSTPEKGRAAAEALHIGRAYDSYEELLADPAVRVVHLASPNYLHYEQCVQALEARKHVVCEKPLALTAAQAQELVDRAKRTPVVTAVCYNVRFYPLCLEARQLIRDGQLGDVYHVTGSYLQDWLLFETDYNWRVLSGEGGELRAVADLGTTWLDLVTWVTGLEVQSVCADLHTFLPTRQRPTGPAGPAAGPVPAAVATEPVAVDTEDYGSVLLRFKEGPTGCVTVSQLVAGRKNYLRYEAAGAGAALAWDTAQPNDLWIGHRDRPNELLPRDPALLHRAVRRFSQFPGGHNEGFPDTFKQLFRAVYDYIAAGDRKAPRLFPTFEDGHREAVLAEAILQSHRERRWVDVPG